MAEAPAGGAPAPAAPPPPSREKELLLARLAIRKRWTPPPRMVEALLLQATTGFRRPLGDILVEKGTLSPAQVKELLALRANPARPLEDDEEPVLPVDPAADPRIGKVISSVRLDARLERKTFWSTFAGRRPNDPEPVSIKLVDTAALRSGLWMDFLETVRASVNVKSPNVVPVLEVGRAEGAFAIVSRYSDGFTLATLLEKVRRIRLSEALRIGKEIAKGLRDLHKANIVHRNVQPSSVWLPKKGQPALQDAGLAIEPAGVKRVAERNVIYGSPWYVSPEGTKGDVDARSDTYSLGVVIYEMITGVRPFEGFGVVDLVPQHQSGLPVPPDQFLTDVPVSVGDLLLTMLAKKKDERPNDDDLVRELEKLEAAAPKPGMTRNLGKPPA